jgi:hypothetical protein
MNGKKEKEKGKAVPEEAWKSPGVPRGWGSQFYPQGYIPGIYFI